MSVVVAAVARALDPVTRAWVSGATAYSRFAGGDGDSVQVGDRYGLGHALLRTDQRQIAQPVTLDGRVWVSADARLDNRAGLIASLRPLGQHLDPAADEAELLLRAYAAWGERFLDHLAGDFAFALWDGERRRLLCARDQIGVVPLHYTALNGQLLVATSPEALLLHPAVNDRLDEDWIADFLLAGRPTDFGATVFESIRRLPPAHVLSWTDGELRLRRYWRQTEFEPVLHLRHPADYVDHFRHLLELAVRDRISSGPLAVQLSGGMDSTAVAAFAHRVRASSPASAGAMRGVTAVLGASSGDEEGDYASMVAEKLGIDLDVIDDSALGASDPFAEPKLLTPEPTPYLWSGLQYQVASVAAQHARICLSGLGADPLLGFVPWYCGEWLAKGRGVRLAVTFADQARLFRDRPHLHMRMSAHYILRAMRRPSPATPEWLNGEFATRIGASARGRALAKTRAWAWDKRSLSRDPIWQTWFTCADPSYTRLELRVRHPFTDLRLLDFAARIAPYPWFADKRILREATEGLLPGAVRRRPKTLLVDAPRADPMQQARQILAEFVRAVPDAAPFLDPEGLIMAILTPATRQAQERTLALPLGLIYWLMYWKRPQAQALSPAGNGFIRRARYDGSD